MATRRPRTRTRTSRYTHVTHVEVFLWGERVGVVALDPTYGFYVFRYTPEFRARGIEPAPFYMPTPDDRTFLFTDLPVESYKRLPAMLADALPDDFGNALINRWMLDRGIRVEDNHVHRPTGLHEQPCHGGPAIQACTRAGHAARGRHPFERTR